MSGIIHLIIFIIYLYLSCRVNPNTTCQEERKFIVFYSSLLTLFSLFCLNCKAEKPQVSMKQNGTMVTVQQHCTFCQGKSFTWRSQPFLFGKHPAGNILLSFSVLMAGATISKILLLFKHMGVSVYKARTFFYHQNRFIFPTILHHWEQYRSSMISSIKNVKDTVWCGDGRFDSMGHSAKYGAYTILCSSINKIVHFELLQVTNTYYIPILIYTTLNFWYGSVKMVCIPILSVL